MGLTAKSSIVRSKFNNQVGDYEITYDVSQNAGENANNVLGNIKKGDIRIGYINCELNGRKSITIENGVTDDEVKLIVSTVIDDASNIFNELNKA